MPGCLLRLVSVWVVFVPLFDCPLARAETNRWLGGTGTWSSPSAWTLGRVPQADDDVMIDAPGTYLVSLDVSPTVASLVVQGDMPGAIVLQANNGAPLTLRANTVALGQASLVLMDGSVVEATAVDLGSGGRLSFPPGAPAVFATPLTIHSGGQVTASAVVTFQAAVTTAGNISAVGGARVDFNAPLSMLDGASFEGPVGVLSTASLTGTVTAQAFTSGPTLTANGTLTTAAFTCGAGSTISGVLTLAGDGLRSLDGCTLHGGTLEVSGAWAVPQAMLLHMAEGGVFRNAGILDQPSALAFLGMGAVENTGTWSATGSGALEVTAQVEFRNRGTLTGGNAGLWFLGGLVQTSGTLTLGGNVRMGTSTARIEGGTAVGWGALAGHLVNAGRLVVSKVPSSVHPLGDVLTTFSYTQLPTGTLEFVVLDDGTASALDCQENASLAGRLAVELRQPPGPQGLNLVSAAQGAGGQFDGLPEGATFMSGGHPVSITYRHGGQPGRVTLLPAVLSSSSSGTSGDSSSRAASASASWSGATSGVQNNGEMKSSNCSCAGPWVSNRGVPAYGVGVLAAFLMRRKRTHA